MPTKPNARIVLDSISPIGQRLTTMEITMHRFVLAEFNTHRAFSRNSASSRAIPIEKRIQSVLDDPAMPLEWGSNQAGMQAGDQLTLSDIALCQDVWLESRDNAVMAVRNLDYLKLHKQVANRLLEPFLWHTALVSSTEWENFFEQRATPVCPDCQGLKNWTLNDRGDKGTFHCSLCKGSGLGKSLAQPEMTAVANAMRDTLNASTPERREWHMPYLADETRAREVFTHKELQLISVARCARVSYAHFDTNTANTAKDLLLADKLFSAKPPHMSPFEHVAQTDVNNECDSEYNAHQQGNFTGWRQLRHMVFGK